MLTLNKELTFLAILIYSFAHILKNILMAVVHGLHAGMWSHIQKPASNRRMTATVQKKPEQKRS